MSIIYLFRHAEAEDAYAGKSDYERKLTKTGREQVKTIAKFCNEQEIMCDEVWASPYLRTMETAKILLNNLPKNKNKIIKNDYLAIASSLPDCLYEISNFSIQNNTNAKLLIVSHEPNISMMISKLVGSQNNIIKIKKASLTSVRLSIDLAQNISGKIMWSLYPELLNDI